MTPSTLHLAVADRPIRVALSDDHEFARHSLQRVLAEHDRIDVVAVSRARTRAVRDARRHRADVLVIDVGLPAADTAAAIGSLCARLGGIAVVVTTMIAEPELARAALAAGASGYVLKDRAGLELAIAVAQAAYGARFVSPTLAATAGPQGGDALLSESERELLRLVAFRRTDAEIAVILGLPAAAVAGRRARLHRVLEVESDPELVRYAVRRGLLMPPPESALAAS